MRKLLSFGLLFWVFLVFAEHARCANGQTESGVKVLQSHVVQGATQYQILGSRETEKQVDVFTCSTGVYSATTEPVQSNPTKPSTSVRLLTLGRFRAHQPPEIPVPLEFDTFYQLLTQQDSSQMTEIQSLVESGKLVWVKNRTKVAVLPDGDLVEGAVRISILEGPYAGRQGIVQSDWLR